MIDPYSTEGLVIAATVIRVPPPGHRPDAVLALVELAGGRRLVTLPVEPSQMPVPGDLVKLK